MENLTKGDVRRAGEKLRGAPSSLEQTTALYIANQWRELHFEPLRRVLDIAHAATLGMDAPVAGRIKKRDTIIDKLSRFPHSKLDTLYDIAGCRIVVNDLDALETLCASLEQRPECDLVQSAKRNYLDKTHKTGSGYRGRHLVLRFDDLDCGLRLSVELQIRTQLQHLWSTAVELYDRARGTRLKFGERNTTSWDFFRRASELIRREEEGEEINAREIREMFPIPDASGVSQRIIRELKEASEASSLVFSDIEDNFEFCVIDFVPSEQYILLVGADAENAMTKYSFYESSTVIGEVESNVPHDTVLVKGQSVNQLSMLYPNYFGDISEFLRLVDSNFDVFC